MQPARRTITVETRTVYGNDRIYPVCEAALLVARLVGKQTFSPLDIRLIRQLGFDVVEQHRVNRVLVQT